MGEEHKDSSEPPLVLILGVWLRWSLLVLEDWRFDKGFFCFELWNGLLENSENGGCLVGRSFQRVACIGDRMKSWKAREWVMSVYRRGGFVAANANYQFWFVRDRRSRSSSWILRKVSHYFSESIFCLLVLRNLVFFNLIPLLCDLLVLCAKGINNDADWLDGRFSRQISIFLVKFWSSVQVPWSDGLLEMLDIAWVSKKNTLIRNRYGVLYFLDLGLCFCLHLNHSPFRCFSMLKIGLW